MRATTPYWADSATHPSYSKLDRDIDVDAVVIGGGITGLTTAYLLLAAGKSVAVLERSRCASIDTGHTSAHLTMVTDVRLHDLVGAFGQDHARAAWDAGAAAIELIDELSTSLAIDCSFQWVDAYLHTCDRSQKDVALLEKDAELAAGMGFDATFVNEGPLAAVPGVRFGSQARFHPRQYLAGLSKAIIAAGGTIYEHSEAEEFCDEPRSVKANGHTITCADIIIATHTPLVGVAGMVPATVFQTKLALYSTYVVAGRVPTGTVEDALCCDTGDPYDYLRIDRHRDFDVVIFGGEDHKTGQDDDTEARFERLEKRLLARVPDVQLMYRWSGQVIETPDGLPYIGRSAEHQYMATGFAGNGMTFGTIGAMIMSDAILGRKNPWADLFDPGRAAVRRGGLWDYIKENVDYPYYLVRDRLARAEAPALRVIKRGAGKVVEYDNQKVAASRDGKGVLSLCSAICTHMGCVVAWNPAERTWDCPCHGSRFTPGGKVISGPAEEPLAEVKKK